MIVPLPIFSPLITASLDGDEEGWRSYTPLQGRAVGWILASANIVVATHASSEKSAPLVSGVEHARTRLTSPEMKQGRQSSTPIADWNLVAVEMSRSHPGIIGGGRCLHLGQSTPCLAREKAWALLRRAAQPLSSTATPQLGVEDRTRHKPRGGREWGAGCEEEEDTGQHGWGHQAATVRTKRNLQWRQAASSSGNQRQEPPLVGSFGSSQGWCL